MDQATARLLKSRLRKSAAALDRAAPTRRNVRKQARLLAQHASEKLDEMWDTGTEAVGPIDVIDMFSGCGGMSAGFHAANTLLPAFRNAMAVDIDPVANATYEANFGLRPETVDVTCLARRPSATTKLVQAARQSSRSPLVLIGCAPCQGFSSHRNKLGSQDERNSLFISFARVAATIQPDVIVCENVPELLSVSYWPYLERAKSILEASGYVVRIDIHNLAEFGVPQQRFRAVVVAAKKRFALPQGFLANGSFRTVRDTIGALPPLRAGQRDSDDPMHYTVNHKSSTIETIRRVPRNGGRLPEGAGPACLWRAKARNGRAVYEDVYGRLWWDRPAITMTAYSRNPASGRYVHPEQNRGLSVREAALLQGFPASFQFSGSLDAQFRQIGNAVPPRFSAFLALHLLGELLADEQSNDQHGIVAPVGASFARLIPAIKAGHRQIGQAKEAF